MEKRLLLVLNPCAGQRRANRFLPEIIRMVIEHGYECTTYVTGFSGDATEYIRGAAKQYDRIICAGGDGTLNETIAGVVGAGANCPIGYIPCGTTNDYAASIGLSSDVLQAARDALEGEAYRFDRGSFNGKHFTYTATCGAFAKTSYTTPQAVKNLLGHFAYLLEGVKDLSTLRPIHMRVEADDYAVEGDFLLCAVTNSLSVGGVLKLDKQIVNLNDGKFEVMMVRYPTQAGQLAKILVALSSNDLPSEMIEFFKTAHLHITTDPEVEWTFDGERGERGCEFDVQNVYRSIQLILPRDAVETVPACLTEMKTDDQLPD